MTDVQPRVTPGLELVVRVPLSQDEGAPAQARAAIRHILARWRLAALLDTVVLVASELVTNAVRYGKPPVELTVRRREHEVRVDVHDDNLQQPNLAARGHAHADAESGRGLEIVHALADKVGVEQVEDDGKIVYASFRVDEAAVDAQRRAEGQ